MNVIRTTKVADAVLALVELELAGVDLAEGDIYVEPYQNGREHGWAVSTSILAGDHKVAFAENRNSDHIVVYVGAGFQFDAAGNVPNGAAYKTARYFYMDGILEAVQYIVLALVGWSSERR